MDNLKKKRRKHRPYKTGEDIDMLREKQRENNNKRSIPICDRHIDGA